MSEPFSRPDGTFAPMVEMWQPALGQIHTRFRRVLLSCGALLIASCVLPVRVEWHQTLWSWTVLDRWSAIPGVCAPFIAGIAFALLARWKRGSTLVLAAIAAVMLLLASWCVASNPDTGEALLYGLPPQIQSLGWILIVALIAAGGASQWVGGPRQGARARRPMLVMVGISWAAMLALLVGPTRGRLLIEVLLRSVREIFSLEPGAIGRGNLTVNFLVSTMPLMVAAVVSLLALKWHVSRARWVIAVPPVILVMWGMEVAMQFGSDASFGVGLRAALLLAAQLLFGINAVEAALGQLYDVHVPDSLARTGLLRDALLARALAAGRDPASAAVGYRPWVQRLVRERYESLALANDSTNRSSTDLRVRLRLGEWAQEDVTLLSDDEVRERLARIRLPDVPPLVSAFARGHRIEVMAAAGLAIVLLLAAGVRWLDVPSAPTWGLSPAPAWASTLYHELLPDIGIAAGKLGQEGGGDALSRAVDAAVREASPAPAVAKAIRDLAALTDRPGERRRAILQASDRLNEAARRAHLPFYADASVLTVFDAENVPTYAFFIKTYRINRAQAVRAGRGSYEVLWLDRLDETNVAETRLAWRKRGAPYAMVLLDVVRDYWPTQLAPLLQAEAEDPSYGRARTIRSAMVRVLVASGLSPVDARRKLAASLPCADKPGDSSSPSCVAAEKIVEPPILAMLAQEIEGHELQHQIDADSLRPPQVLWQAMSGHDDETVLRATNELSAYLAEIIRAPDPRIALGRFDHMARDVGSPEYYAGEVAGPLLVGNQSVADVIDNVPPDQIRQRAAKAYATFFGKKVPPLLTAYRE